jgi:transcriptional regulator with XRE-family HTH domain
MNRYELLRYERGLTQGQVAEGSGIPVRTVRSLEEIGHRPSAPTAKALADFYEISIQELLGLESEAA